MNTAARLGIYGAGLAVVFGGVYVAADAVVPQSTVDSWTTRAKGHEMSTDHTTVWATAPQAARAATGVTAPRRARRLSCRA